MFRSSDCSTAWFLLVRSVVVQLPAAVHGDFTAALQLLGLELPGDM
jgi:hypothetical protein